jgi:hypothetical protein
VRSMNSLQNMNPDELKKEHSEGDLMQMCGLSLLIRNVSGLEVVKYVNGHNYNFMMLTIL